MGAADLAASASPYGAAAKVLGDALGGNGGQSSGQTTKGNITGPVVNFGSDAIPADWSLGKVAAVAVGSLALLGVVVVVAKKATKGGKS